MTNVINNLLKLTDYPFVYSLAGILLLSRGHRIDLELEFTNFGPLLTMIGLVATTLSITDPFGNLMRFLLQTFPYRSLAKVNRIITRFQRGLDPLEYKSYFRSLKSKAVFTNWISYEIDKIVAIFYFLIILVLIVMALSNQFFFNNVFSIFYAESVGDECVPLNKNLRIILFIFVGMAIPSVSLIATLSVRKLAKHTQTIMIYFVMQERAIPQLKESIRDQNEGNKVEILQGCSQTL